MTEFSETQLVSRKTVINTPCTLASYPTPTPPPISPAPQIHSVYLHMRRQVWKGSVRKRIGPGGRRNVCNLSLGDHL